MTKKNKLIVLASVLLALTALWLYSYKNLSNDKGQLALDAYQNSSYKQAEEILKNMQVDDPSNPQTSYNLGLAGYQQNRFSTAQSHFNRAAEESEKRLSLVPDKTSKGQLTSLASKSHSNASKSVYRDVEKTVKEKSSSHKELTDWSPKKSETKLKDEVIENLKTAVKSSESALFHNPNSEADKNNIEHINRLIKKLEEQSEQENDQDKGDQGEQNQNDCSKDSCSNDNQQNGQSDKEKQEKSKDQNQGSDDQQSEQNKSDSNQKDQNESNSNNSKEQSEKSDSSESDSSEQDNSEKDSQENKDSDKEQNDKEENKDTNKSDGQKEKSESDDSQSNDSQSKDSQSKDLDDANKKLDEQKEKLEQESENEFEQKREQQKQANKSEKSSQDETADNAETSADYKKEEIGTASNNDGNNDGESDSDESRQSPWATADENSETLEDRSARLLLEKLDSNEATLQKRRILMQSRTGGQRKQGQKPW